MNNRIKHSPELEHCSAFREKKKDSLKMKDLLKKKLYFMLYINILLLVNIKTFYKHHYLCIVQCV